MKQGIIWLLEVIKLFFKSPSLVSLGLSISRDEGCEIVKVIRLLLSSLSVEPIELLPLDSKSL